jgi:hypothetical protein
MRRGARHQPRHVPSGSGGAADEVATHLVAEGWRPLA